MHIHLVQSFFLGICAAAFSLFLFVCCSLVFDVQQDTLVRVSGFGAVVLIFLGAVAEESVRVLMLYSLWHRRNDILHLPMLGTLMGLGFGLSEVTLRISSMPLSDTHISEYFGLAGITTLHCVLGLLCGFIASRFIALPMPLLRPLPVFLTISFLSCVHFLYNLAIVFWLSPFLDRLL